MAEVALVASRGGATTMRAWLQWDLVHADGSTVTTYRFSKTAYNDSSSYHGGRKVPRVLKFGSARRAFTDHAGQFQGFGFDVDFADTDHFFRGLLADTNKKYWPHRIGTLYAIDDAAARAGSDPRVIARGVGHDYKLPRSLRAGLTFEDFLTSEFSTRNINAQVPRRTIVSAIFADCPTANLGRPEPIWYGSIGNTTYGAVPGIYVGTETIAAASWGRVLIAGHACKAIDHVYAGGVNIDANAGVTLLAPGMAGWPFAEGYRDIGGRRYTIIYVSGPTLTDLIDNGVPVNVDLQGMESVGDCSGTLLETAFDQYLNFLEYFGFNSANSGLGYLTGTWASNTPPNWDPHDVALEYVDSASFTAAQAASATRMGDATGYIGTWGLGSDGTQRALRDVLAELNISFDVDAGYSRSGQYMVSLMVPTASATATFTQARDIEAGGIEMSDDEEARATHWPYRFAKNYTQDGWASDHYLSEWHQAAANILVTRYLKARHADVFELPMVVSSSTAANVMRYRMMRYANPPRWVPVVTALHGLNQELGDVIGVTHSDGTGASGWTARKCRIEAIEADLDAMTATLVCRDLEAIPSIVSGEQTITVGGDSATAPTVQAGGGSIINYNITQVVAAITPTYPLVGSRMISGTNVTGWQKHSDFRQVRINWNNLSGLTPKVHYELASSDPATAAIVQVRLKNVTDTSTDATSSTTTTSLTEDWALSALSGVKVYELWYQTDVARWQPNIYAEIFFV